MVTWDNAPDIDIDRGIHRIETAVALFDEGWWVTGRHTRVEADAEYIRDVRPLAVIDPEDREQVRAIADAAYPEGRANTNRLQAALREFANPTPPKPEEPTGLGAVVEDASGVRHVRTFAGSAPGVAWLGHIQGDGGERTRRWSDIDAVKVLSGGVIA